jgi:RNA polymerase sigma factor (TIGR02999 family)
MMALLANPPNRLDMSDVTHILAQIDSGDPSAAQLLLPLVYDELRYLAAARLAQENPGQTLQATALVHEAYLRLVQGVSGDRPWHSRGHFFAAAAEAMRRILVEQARRKQTRKRGGQRVRITMEDVAQVASGQQLVDLLALDEALASLEAEAPLKAELVKLRFFAGLTLEETAQALEISLSTAKRHWIYARAWLFGKMNGQ